MKRKTTGDEFGELAEFQKFLNETGRMDYLNRNPRKDKCICVVRDFSALATDGEKDPLKHLHEIDLHDGYKGHREHALRCNRCQISLDAMFLFEGLRHKGYFPPTIQKILEKEATYELDKKVKLVKLPAPSSGTFGPTVGKLVYMTNLPLSKAIPLFYERLQVPLNLGNFVDFEIREKIRRYPSGRIKLRYFQANSHHKNLDEHAHISIRSLEK